MKQFLISLLAIALLSVSSLSRAAQVHFHKHIDESCGIEVIKERGEIHFGRRFGSDSLTLKLLANNRDKRLYFRLSYFNIDMGAETISPERIHFKVETPEHFVGNLDFWRQGIELNLEQLDSSKEVRISARVDMNEYQMPAGEFSLNMEWHLDCY
ncbi:hypothetical protein [Vibrio jasicida]|uniref:hypothetical protein n=1 Tax=Vibrio jasicida TaxID=766224 RepID=UPI0005F072B7|nr:hypothetical protein [Vibrio jasicida]